MLEFALNFGVSRTSGQSRPQHTGRFKCSQVNSTFQGFIFENVRVQEVLFCQLNNSQLTFNKKLCTILFFLSLTTAPTKSKDSAWYEARLFPAPGFAKLPHLWEFLLLPISWQQLPLLEALQGTQQPSTWPLCLQLLPLFSAEELQWSAVKYSEVQGSTVIYIEEQWSAVKCYAGQ